VDDDKIDISELMRNEERFRAFMKNSAEAIWGAEFEQPIPIVLPKKIDLIYKLMVAFRTNDTWTLSAGFERNEDLIRARTEDILTSSVDANIYIIHRT
jgi:hypothetical protein